jgi:hypothetical protein
MSVVTESTNSAGAAPPLLAKPFQLSLPSLLVNMALVVAMDTPSMTVPLRPTTEPAATPALLLVMLFQLAVGTGP